MTTFTSARSSRAALGASTIDPPTPVLTWCSIKVTRGSPTASAWAEVSSVEQSFTTTMKSTKSGIVEMVFPISLLSLYAGTQAATLRPLYIRCRGGSVATEWGRSSSREHLPDRCNDPVEIRCGEFRMHGQGDNFRRDSGREWGLVGTHLRMPGVARVVVHQLRVVEPVADARF